MKEINRNGTEIFMRDNINFQTPKHVAQFMVDLISESHISILEPTPGAGNIVNLLPNNKIVYAPENFDDLPKNARFDCVIMNPPFTPMKKGYDILFDCMEMSDNIIALMPWLTLINSEKRMRKIQEFGLSTVYHLPRNVFPRSRVQCCILEMEKN